MGKREHERRRREIIERRTDEVLEHESTGCRGDADLSRRWMQKELEMLEREREGR